MHKHKQVSKDKKGVMSSNSRDVTNQLNKLNTLAEDDNTGSDSEEEKE